MRLSTFSTEDAQARGYAVVPDGRSSHQTVGMRAFCLSIAIALTSGACVSSGGLLDKKAGPIGEAELAAKKTPRASRQAPVQSSDLPGCTA